ncbi:zinc finger protein 70-like [Littorina saxatilis]|uniref:zinc finger protein 70-like n=1 Tax=Littorina saxatilis TaxID=31220 RepID=UPI0038B4E5B3
MIQPPGAERGEMEEELPDMFTFHLALSSGATYQRWREVGHTEQLSSDEDIAYFLLQCYEKVKREGQTDRGVCTRCHLPLKLLCVDCGTDTTLTPSVLPPLADRGQSQMLTTQNDVTLTHNTDYACVKQEAVQHGALADSHQHSSATPPLPQSHLISHQDYMSSSLSPRDYSDSSCTEKTLQPEPTPPHFPIPSQPPGRGRPRMYPAANLVCEVCRRKLSSRQALFSHMTSRHPSAHLPASLSHLAAKQASTGKTRTGGKRGRKPKRTEDVESSDREDTREVAESTMTLRERLQRRKAELESLKCETCGMNFDSKRQMYTHGRLCQWKVCHVCGKSVKQLEMHLKRHSAPRRFPCPHCPKTFLFRNYLEGHLLYHNGQRPFCCEVCGARYREKTRLNAHIRTHTGDKPFKCTQCDAAFTRPRGLHDHMRVHTGEKPYACQVCGRHFSSSGNLAAHRRKVHKLEPQVPNRLTRKLFVEPGLEPASSESTII